MTGSGEGTRLDEEKAKGSYHIAAELIFEVCTAGHFM
jgi:hypothetical protein